MPSTFASKGHWQKSTTWDRFRLSQRRPLQLEKFSIAFAGVELLDKFFSSY